MKQLDVPLTYVYPMGDLLCSRMGFLEMLFTQFSYPLNIYGLYIRDFHGFPIGGQRWDVGYIPAYPLNLYQGISTVVWRHGFTFTSTLAPEGHGVQQKTLRNDGLDTRDDLVFVRNSGQWFSQVPSQKKCCFFPVFFLEHLLEGFFGVSTCLKQDFLDLGVVKCWILDQ